MVAQLYTLLHSSYIDCHLMRCSATDTTRDSLAITTCGAGIQAHDIAICTETGQETSTMQLHA
jgi:hypothetical protein